MSASATSNSWPSKHLRKQIRNKAAQYKAVSVRGIERKQDTEVLVMRQLKAVKADPPGSATAGEAAPGRDGGPTFDPSNAWRVFQ